MRKVGNYLLLICAFMFVVTTTLDARGGRGGGGRGGGGRGGGGRGGGRGRVSGGHRAGGRSAHRSPSMSRSSRSRTPKHTAQRRQPQRRQPQRRPSGTGPSTRPDRRSSPTARQATARRDGPRGRTPTRSNIDNFLNQSSPGIDRMPKDRRPGDRPGGDRFSQFGKDKRPADRPGRDRMAGDRRPSDRAAGDRFDQFKQNRPERQNQRSDLANNLRDQIGDKHPDRGDWFDRDFWNRHDFDPNYNLGDGNAWKWATFAGLNRWGNYGWSDPYYYDYGYPYYDDTYDTTTTDGSYGYAEQETAYTQPDYTQQAQEIAETTTDDPSDDWMSMGVFALAKDKESAGAPNTYLQLALNREGNLAGTFYNTTTDKTYSAEGIVDKSTQRAALMMADSENSPILETGIYNLTQDEAPVRVTFADGSTQQWLLVRMKDPKG